MSWEKMTLEQRVQAANIDCMRHPQFALLSGTICMGKSEVSFEGGPTAATDGNNKWYAPTFIQTFTRKQLRYLVLHENFHVALKHCVLWEDIARKYPRIFGAAIDFVVNGTIEEMDPTFSFVERPTVIPPLVDKKYEGWSLPQVFNDLVKRAKAGGGGGKGQPGGKGGKPGQQPGEGGDEGGEQELDLPGMLTLDNHQRTPTQKGTDERAKLEKSVDDANRQGELVRRKLAGNGSVGRDILGLAAERDTNWQDPLREFIATQCQGDEMSRFVPSNRRMLAAGFVMPTHFSEAIGEIVIASDTSGSMIPYYPVIFGEVVRICEQVRPEKVHLIWWDSAVCGHQIFTPEHYDEIARQLKPAGGGGTTPTCVTEYIAKEEIKPKAIVWLSDGYLFCPDPPTPCPSLWGIVENETFVPQHGKLVRIRT
jgi:predicted metal-dependent peptidase